MKTITKITDFFPSAVERKRVAAYARGSIETESSQHSLDAQVDQYARLIQENRGWEFVGVYTDEGITGTKDDRPGFQKLLCDCESGKVDMILTKSISRFARNTVLLLSTIRHLKGLGISVRFERESIDTLSGNGELLLTLLASFAQAESQSISENTKWGIRRNFERGIGNNFTRLFGYRWDGHEFIIVPDEAEIVRLVFRSYLEGMSPDRIALMLRERGAMPVKGKEFRYESVWLMLRQIKYTGRSLLQKTYKENHLSHRTVKNHGELPRYLAEDTHPVIISVEEFEAVQVELENRKAQGFRANKGVPFTFFTSRIICGQCGKSFRRKIYSHPGHDDLYAKWVCATKIQKGAGKCPSCNLPERSLHAMVSDVLGMENPSEEVLETYIDYLVVSADHELTFHMKDGRLEVRTWKDERVNAGYREWRKHAAE